ncbi:MAG: YigZ family protein [Desulfuromonas sp.]|nr:MAG: YigZ family protein [Desulfuromonas sp.]
MAKARYLIPAETFRCEIEIKRSRFITTIAMTDTPEAAHAFVAAIKEEFPDASHNCWAYLVGPPGSTDRIGLSDDGEPHGTAGKPMLTALQHSGLGDISAVVTRYFGGTKLGTGGLVKAYTEAVKVAIEQMTPAEKIDWTQLRVTFAYPLLERVELLLPEHEAVILDRQYAEQVTLELKLPQENLSELETRLTDLSAGRATLEHPE